MNLNNLEADASQTVNENSDAQSEIVNGMVSTFETSLIKDQRGKGKTSFRSRLEIARVAERRCTDSSR